MPWKAANEAATSRAEEGEASGIQHPTKEMADLFGKNQLCTTDIALCLMQRDGDRVKLTTEDMDSVEEAMGFWLVDRFFGQFPS